MKELDVLLECFLQRERVALDSGSWPEFEDLLRREDDLLWDWVQNPACAEAAPFRRLLEEIRDGRR